MKIQEQNPRPTNEVVKKVQGQIGIREILSELGISESDELFLSEQEVVRVTEENPVIVLEGMGECSCDILRSESTREILVSHTMPPYEGNSIKQLSENLDGSVEITVIGSVNTDSDTFLQTKEIFTKPAPHINIGKVHKVDLGEINFAYTLILDFKNNQVMCIYYDEDNDVTVQKRIALKL